MKIVTKRSPTLAVTVALPPQTRRVLSHLERNRTISPLEAFGVYGITRLAARIHELRVAGFNITRVMNRDAAGKPYARYLLAM